MAIPPKPAPTTNRSIWSTGPRGESIMLDSMHCRVHARGRIGTTVHIPVRAGQEPEGRVRIS